MSGRGGGWVVAQFALIATIGVAAVAFPRWPEAVRTPLALAGAGMALAGVGVAVWAARVLGRSLTPFPRPAREAELALRGPYRVVRHPLYAGGLLFFSGLSLIAGPVPLAATGLLAVLWALKSRVEERYLNDRFPGYAAYSARVRRRLLPGVY